MLSRIGWTSRVSPSPPRGWASQVGRGSAAADLSWALSRVTLQDLGAPWRKPRLAPIWSHPGMCLTPPWRYVLGGKCHLITNLRDSLFILGSHSPRLLGQGCILESDCLDLNPALPLSDLGKLFAFLEPWPPKPPSDGPRIVPPAAGGGLTGPVHTPFLAADHGCLEATPPPPLLM